MTVESETGRVAKRMKKRFETELRSLVGEVKFRVKESVYNTQMQFTLQRNINL